ncbi:hypothetical protein [Chondromyces apiculatus]|uniref:VWFA domain-containing protein n=1 Tax=Chondromyces apiculatus DSM 436 TaxID=1192034 RepID=A0A017SVW7_9BACT|nr:hypothetical protein [Chondromyces apiculatus]EYF01113.1 Hypothetical protein CAP_8618 [Chondromyces apiculatus DSM 436]
MYSWGDDTSDWAKPGAYAYSPAAKKERAEDAARADAHGPRTYGNRNSPNEQLTTPRKRVTSQSATPLIVAVDVTGSMQRWPAEIFDRLPLLYQTLSQYRQDLEICFVAIGDSRSDQWPLQATHFARGFDLETQLHALYGEGGGGDIPESYGLFAHWVHTHVSAPNAERPFLIVFGDAPMHTEIFNEEIKHVLGDDPGQSVSAIAAWHNVCRTWNTWFLRRPGGTRGDNIDKQWASAIGAQQIVHMDDEQRAVDYAMGLIARSWGHFEDFKTNMKARQDPQKVREIEERVVALEKAIEGARGPVALECPRCSAPLRDVSGSRATCSFCNVVVNVPSSTSR